MTTTTIHPASTLARQAFAALVALTLLSLGAAGCGAEGDLAQEEPAAEQVDVTEDSLSRGGGAPRAGFTCTGGTCTCDKHIENDCADMTAVCTDKTVDQVIACINGWATTHCTCTQGYAVPKKASTVVGPRPTTTARK